ncbi:hypothetical protein F4801DRAFT_560155 [Xylaria longipes]|nr:hypothetical protein F4801DRAFT_560155 [Xylaria longipes]RYC64532.1 hypothetical protein CHU98_g1657 [Xylaria longipes]
MAGFRAIIVGGGPAGLFTAHALAAAGIDFVVLERQPEIVRFRGALLVLWPPFVRLMDQLGLYKPALQYSTRFTTKTNFTHSGEPLCSGPVFAAIEDELGYPTIALSRGNLLRVLYENLPGRDTNVRANAHVVKIETNKDGVRVHLADGSVVDGSVVIAADGVHSPARELIQRLGNGSSTSSDSKPTSPMIPGYLSLFGHTRGIREDIALGDFAESHGPGTASQSTRLHDTMYFTVLKRLEGPATEKTKFTPEDVDKFAEEMSDVTIFPGIKLKEIWPRRESANVVLLHQEEGVAEKWYHGRVVIVGDAAHKMTSVNGQGAASATLSAATLVNNLRATLSKNPEPSTEDLEATFAKYEASRKGAATGVVNMGIWVTRFITWTDKENEAQDRKASSVNDMAKEAVNKFVPSFSKSPILDFVPFESEQGNTPWEVKSQMPARPQL